MCFKLIGKKKNLEVYRDTNYTFPEPTPVIIDKEKQQITFGSKIFVFAHNLDSAKIFQVKIDIWIIKFKDTLMGLKLNFDTLLIEYWDTDCKDFHITENGIYIVNSEFWAYKSFDFEIFNSKNCKGYSKEKSDTVTFYKKFVIVRKKYYSDIYVNTDDLPDFNINLEYSLPYFILYKNKILVHFKDISKKSK